MSVTVVESNQLGNPYECPLCWRLFYFENDYVRHKCAARKARINLSKKKISFGGRKK